jgi:hypothetical protein
MEESGLAMVVADLSALRSANGWISQGHLDHHGI